MLRHELLPAFDAAVTKADLMVHRDALLADARECVRFRYGERVKSVPLGASRIGGLPDLPASVEWPSGMKDGKPSEHASFLAQFNLAELPAVDDGLPRQGHLWIFVRSTWDYPLPVSVIFRDGSERLVRAKKPSSVLGFHHLNLMKPTFSVGVSLPFSSKAFRRKWESLPFDALGKLQEAMGGNLDSYAGHSGWDGQIGGYSFQFEKDLCREIAFEKLGRAEYAHADGWFSLADCDASIERGLPFPGTSEEQKRMYRESLMERRPMAAWIEANEETIAATAASIGLLCMFRPDWDLSLDFGDGMFLDFFIEAQALSRRDFSNVDCRLPMLL